MDLELRHNIGFYDFYNFALVHLLPTVCVPGVADGFADQDGRVNDTGSEEVSVSPANVRSRNKRTQILGQLVNAVWLSFAKNRETFNKIVNINFEST